MGILKNTYKKNMEQFKQLGLGHEQEFNEEIDLVTTDIDVTKYDVVDITEVEPDTIAYANRKLVGLEALLKKVVLNDFILCLRDSGNVMVRFRIHCYEKNAHPIVANDGKKYRRLIDLYQLGNDDNEVLNICQVVLLYNKFPPRYHIRRVGMKAGKRIATKHIGAFERYEELEKRGNSSPFMRLMARLADPDWEERTLYVLYHYLFVLNEMVNCPERFVESGDGQRRILKGVNEVKKSRTIIPTHGLGPTSELEVGHTIQCPYWTVRGHYRTLKSGKKVWVKPYVKGKYRHDPDQIVAKTYKIS